MSIKGKIRRIYQVLPYFSKRDAIGTDVQLIDTYLHQRGIPSGIFFDECGPEQMSKHISEMSDHLMHETLIIYHFSVASRLAYFLGSLPCPIWTRYHNITPAHFFNDQGERGARQACLAGRTQIPFVSALSDLIIADSDYNGNEMRPFTRANIHTLPIFRNYQDLAQMPDDLEFLGHLKTLSEPILLFVGRIAPNKCQHDIIQLAYLYRIATGKRLRVILAGTFFSDDYRKVIAGFAKSLGMIVSEKIHINSDVMVLGSVSDRELATLYRHSQVFVSMSEHEGFGVPLVESLWFDLPVLAHDASAVPETLGGAGTIVNKKDWIGVVDSLHLLLSRGNPETMKRQMMSRREELSTSSCENIFGNLIDRYLTLKN